MSNKPARPQQTGNAGLLLNVVLGARRAGDKLLESAARQQLMERHQVKVQVKRDKK